MRVPLTGDFLSRKNTNQISKNFIKNKLMLFIDNEQFKLPDTLITELRRELINGKILKFPKRLQSKTVDSDGNSIVEYPSVRSIPYVANVDLDMDTFTLASKSTSKPRYAQIRYCETLAGTKDKPVYRPSGMTQFVPLQSSDYELYWFLKYCSMFVENGLNASANRNKNYSCIIWEPEKEEKEQADRDALIFRAMGFIYNIEEENGLSEEKLRNIAAAFNVSDSISGRLAGIRVKLKAAVEKDEVMGTVSGDPGLKGYKYLIKLATENYDFTLRANVTKAVELGVIEYVPDRKGWYFLGDTEKGAAKEYVEKIVSCEPTVDSKESYLVNFFNKNAEMKERFEQKFKERQTPVGGEADYEKLKAQKAQYESDGNTDKVIETIKEMLILKPKNNLLKNELKQLEATIS